MTDNARAPAADVSAIGKDGEGLRIVIGGFKNTPGVRTPWELTERQWDEIRAAAPAAEFRYSKDLEADDSGVEDAEIVAGSLSATAFARTRKLKWQHSWKAGPNDMMFPEMIESPVVLTCCAGNGAIPLAEHALMLMLMLSRNMPQLFLNQQARHWERNRHGELNNHVCGIIGLGNIGTDLALKCKAMHMNVLGLRRKQEPVENVDELFPEMRLHDFLSRCDFVVLTVPLTPATRRFIDAAALRSMKPTAFLINIARGGLIEDEALLRALREGWIAGAGLDANTDEPLPEDSPFWTLPNAIITPHIGATTPWTVDRGVGIFVDNLRRYIEGRPLRNVVDKRQGY